MAQQELWNIAEKRMLGDRGAVSKEDGGDVREELSR